MLTGNSILIDVDAYKVSMWKQYPPGTEYVSSYIESRGSESSELTFFGLQHILSVLEQKITASDVEQANEYWTAQGQDFPLEQWKYIANTLDGKLPLRVQALPEGTRVGPKTAMVQEKRFDDPDRSIRGYTLTTAFRFELPPAKKLFTLTGGDDADAAEWVPIEKVRHEDLTEDHYHILQSFDVV